jgi:hypothetical protein
MTTTGQKAAGATWWRDPNSGEWRVMDTAAERIRIEVDAVEVAEAEPIQMWIEDVNVLLAKQRADIAERIRKLKP